jgi:hypothetical protein
MGLKMLTYERKQISTYPPDRFHDSIPDTIIAMQYDISASLINAVFLVGTSPDSPVRLPLTVQPPRSPVFFLFQQKSQKTAHHSSPGLDRAYE